MLSYEYFCSCVRESISRFEQRWVNDRQERSISADPFPPLFIVAGPGTGKTTVLALRVIKLIFVDGFPPDSIIATTFTRKAATELRSRILSWGYATLSIAKQKAVAENNNTLLEWLKTIDINSVQTGTLDSLAEEMVSNDRFPGEIAPTVIEKVASFCLLRKHALFKDGRYNNQELIRHLSELNPSANTRSFSGNLSLCESFCSRTNYDSIDLLQYRTYSTGHSILTDIVNDYYVTLRDKNYMDYALLEATLLEKLRNNRLLGTTTRLRALLVDEFQDTNYLQEQVYYELCRQSNASLTVVGDDDQSLYRFRGATVEIFAAFESRLVQHLGNNWAPRREDLIENYRSTDRIVNFFNDFAFNEPGYQGARVPDKNRVIASAPWANEPEMNLPVLGMFRDDVNQLAQDLSALLLGVFRGDGFALNLGGNDVIVHRGAAGNFGDAVVLGRTAAEYTKSGNPRLPLFLRNIFADENINVFNPRGRDLTSILEVSQLLGLMLMCIDPNQIVENELRLTNQLANAFQDWRDNALSLMQSNPDPGGLEAFVVNWGERRSTTDNWPREWPLLELMFTLITWFPLFQNNPEGQVYLEAVARAITEAGQVSSYRSLIIYGDQPHQRKSVENAFREVFQPLAEGSIDVNEEIMPYVPRNYLPIMTIHQAKGLEYPFVIVDVGSDYKQNNHKQKPYRYPQEGANVHFTEDIIANVSPVGPARLNRDRRQRAFDDVRRQYYVANSRPQQLLLLVGLTSLIRQNKPVPTIALGDLMGGGPRIYDFVYSHEYTTDHRSNTIVLI